MPDQDYADRLGELAAALAKAQAAFPTIKRDKEVTVTSDKGSYKFKYAPLDAIIEAVRGPLAEHGLAFTQLLDSDPDGLPFLVSRLLHESGGYIEGRTPIPFPEGAKVQAFGSAITYVRRYALQAMLGIAAEEDDDGNAASGNRAAFKGDASEPNIRDEVKDGGLIGIAEKGASVTSDFELRETSEGWFLGFRLKGGGRKSGWLVEVHGDMAQTLKTLEGSVIGARVQVWGHTVKRDLKNGGSYQAYYLTKISTPEFTLPATDGLAGDAAPPVGEAKGSYPDAPAAAASTPAATDMTPDTGGAGETRDTREAATRSSMGEEEAARSEPVVPVAGSGSLCGDKGPASIPGGAICNQLKGHDGKHRELASDGRVLASW